MVKLYEILNYLAKAYYQIVVTGFEGPFAE